MLTEHNTGRVRLFLQIIFFLFIMWISLAHTFNWWGGENLHGLCPFGGVTTLYTFFTTGDFIHQLGQSNYILIISLFVTLVASGAFFCGWICPLGSVQEWVGKIGKRIFGDKYNHVPAGLDNVLSYLRYLVLALVIIQTARSFTIVFENFDPYYNLFNIWTDKIAITGYLSVLVVLSASLYVERPFCRYACPLGAINGLFNYFSFLNIKRNESSCTDCKACDSVCPVNINVSEVDRVNDSTCVKCMKCVESCPVNKSRDTLKITLPGRNSRAVKGVVYGVVLLLLFAAPIGIATGMGVFGLEDEQVFETVEDIRGSYTIEATISNYDIDKDTLYRAFNLKQNLGSATKLKDLENINGTTVGQVRDVVGGIDQPVSSLVNELPAGVEPGTTAREFIKTQAPGAIIPILKIPEEDKSVLDEEGKEIEVKGKTMLVDIKGMVDDYKAFTEEFSIPRDVTLNTKVRDLVKDYGVTITEIKEYLAEHGR